MSSREEPAPPASLVCPLSNLLSYSHTEVAPGPSSPSSIEDMHVCERYLRSSDAYTLLTNKLRRSKLSWYIADLFLLLYLPVEVLRRSAFSSVSTLCSRYRTIERVHYGDQGRQGRRGQRAKVVYSSTYYSYHSSTFAFSSGVRPKKPPRDRKTTVVFVHGGAWGTGSPKFYLPFLHKLNSLGYDAALIGYRLSPVNDSRDQIRDVLEALEVIAGKASGNRIVLAGHSSGAHIALFATLLDSSSARQPFVDVFVGLSGVYDVEAHYDYEARRGLEQLSPMQVANGWTRENMRGMGVTFWGEFELGEKRLLQLSNRKTEFILLHGVMDVTVPFTQSKFVSDWLEGVRGGDAVKVLYGKWDHMQPMFDFCYGGECLYRVLQALEEGDRGARAEGLRSNL